MPRKTSRTLRAFTVGLVTLAAAVPATPAVAKDCKSSWSKSCVAAMSVPTPYRR